MNIDIPEEQLYTIEMLAHDMERLFTGVKVSENDTDPWDISYIDGYGDRRWMSLDGTAYYNESCEDNYLDSYLDYRDVVGKDMIWVVVPPSVDRHRVIGIIK